jgi:uroporphyrinogen-III synthase
MPRLLSLFPTLPAKPRFAAIGPKTAKELAAFGVNEVLVPERQFDSEHLLSLPDLQDMSQQKVMIFRGLGGRELLAETLQQRGAEITFAESYQRSNPQTDTQRLSQLWQNKRLHGIVVTSSEALRNLLDMTKHDQSDWLRQITVCVNHKRIAELALSHGLKVLVAKAPGDDAMLECLKENLRP